MKKLILLLIALIPALTLISQAPMEFSYQAILRDASGDPLTSVPAELRMVLHEGLATGPVMYSEEHSLITNEFGLINISIGSGTVIFGSMSSIDWSTGNYFLEVLQDLGSGYVTIGTSQMLSVPYSLYAESAKVQTDNTISGNGQLSSPIGISQQGAEPGEVLMWNGAAWIPDSLDIVFPSGQCQTLDQSYDCDTPGAGRTINADNGAVHIIALGNDGLEITGIGAAESGVSANIEGAGGTGFRANLIDGVGTGLYVGISSEGSKGIYVEHNANSQGLYMHSSAPGAGIEIEKDNTATGNSILTQNLNSSDNAVSIEALQLGTGHAIQGVSGQTPALFAHETGETSGVSGIAFMQGPAENGVAGISGNGDGVWGFTHRPVNIDGSNGPESLDAGVYGTARFEEGTLTGLGDLVQGVVGYPESEGNGVFGIGNGDGHGVIGLSGRGENGTVSTTTTGVLGFAYDYADWNTQQDSLSVNNPLKNKGRIAVAGLAKSSIGVWGESRTKIAMVATSGLEASASALPQDCSIGLYAKADRTDGYAGYFNLTGASSNPGVFINSNSQKYGLHINQYNDAVGLFVHSNDSTSASIDSTSVYILNDGKGKTLHLRNPDTGSNSIFIHGQSHSTGHGINMQMLNSASAGTGILVEHGGTGSGIVSTLFNPTNTGIAIRGTQAGKNSVAVFETLPGNASTGSVDSPAVVIKQHNNGEGINLELMPTVVSPAGFRMSNHGSGIGIHLISDHPTSTAAGILVGQSSPGKGAVLLTLADISTENEEPTFQAVNMCKGSAADFRVDLPVNENPAVAITHAGIGRSLYLSATNAGYTGEVATIENAGSGKALSVETSNPGTTTLSIFEVGGPASPGKQRVAHFNQPIGGAAFYNEAVLISSSGSNPMVPVLKVTSGLSALGTAAEFDGSLDVTGGIDLTGDVSTFGEVSSGTMTTGFLSVGSVDAGSVVALSITAPVKMFTIDHPLDPENKTLRHACIESDEVMNLYSGSVVLDENGSATVIMPEWFDALNTDCRYQLTCVGGFANVYIAEKMRDNRFRIDGGYTGLEVSWQVTAVRHDRYVEEHPMQVVSEK